MSMGELSVMDNKGDTKVAWNSDNRDEVDNARRTFDDLKAKGYSAFRVNKKGDQGEEMKTFDAAAEHVIMVPRMAGGR